MKDSKIKKGVRLLPKVSSYREIVNIDDAVASVDGLVFYLVGRRFMSEDEIRREYHIIDDKMMRILEIDRTIEELSQLTKDCDSPLWRAVFDTRIYNLRVEKENLSKL